MVKSNETEEIFYVGADDNRCFEDIKNDVYPCQIDNEYQCEISND